MNTETWARKALEHLAPYQMEAVAILIVATARAEREACARIAEEALIDCSTDPEFENGINGHSRDIADKIRRRGK